MEDFLFFLYGQSGGIESSAIRDILLLDGNDSIVLGLMNTLYDLVVPIGLMLMVIYFLANLTEKSMTGKDFSPEELTFSILKIVVGGILITHGAQIANFAITAGNYMLDMVWGLMTAQEGVTTGDLTETNANLKKAFSELDFIQGLVMIIPGLFIFILRAVAYGLLKLQAYTRIYEIIFRIVIIPIGLADLFSDGMRSSGIRYIKKLVACTINGGMMMLSIYILTILGGSNVVAFGESTGIESLLSFFGALLDSVIIPFTAIGALGLGKTAVNDAFGV